MKSRVTTRPDLFSDMCFCKNKMKAITRQKFIFLFRLGIYSKCKTTKDVLLICTSPENALLQTDSSEPRINPRSKSISVTLTQPPGRCCERTPPSPFAALSDAWVSPTILSTVWPAKMDSPSEKTVPVILTRA